MQPETVVGDNCDRIHRFILYQEYEPSACARIVRRALGIKIAPQGSSQIPRPRGEACGLAARRSNWPPSGRSFEADVRDEDASGGQRGALKLSGEGSPQCVAATRFH
jgi:hypothetical protein